MIINLPNHSALRKELLAFHSFVEKIALDKSPIVFVGTPNHWSATLAKTMALSTKQHHYCAKWNPGLFTNWQYTLANIKLYNNYKNKLSNILATDEKFSGLSLETHGDLKQFFYLESKIHGLENLSELPMLVIFLDNPQNGLLLETTKCHIPTAALINQKTTSYKNRPSTHPYIQYPISLETQSKSNSLYIASLMEKIIKNAYEKI